MRIGIDFDNTIANYDHVFRWLGRRYGYLSLAFAGDKAAVKAEVLARPNGERDWMAMQGKVYGALMGKANLMDGCGAFLRRCRERQFSVQIISHKTRFGHFDNCAVDLREAAINWMTEKHFFDSDGFGLKRPDVHFLDTRQEKVIKIKELGCTHFIDDLLEVLYDLSFPDGVNRYLLSSSHCAANTNEDIKACSNWACISELIFEGE